MSNREEASHILLPSDSIFYFHCDGDKIRVFLQAEGKLYIKELTVREAQLKILDLNNFVVQMLEKGEKYAG